MTQPPAYTPVHSFITDSATLADFPGQDIDIELAAVKITTDAIRTNLALIQRDDGELANSVVGYDQLSAGLQTAGLAPATAWLTATAYGVGDNVVQNGALYRALLVHTSGVFATDLAAAKWLFVATLPASTGTMIGPVSSTTGNVPKFRDAAGQLIDDSGVSAASLAARFGVVRVQVFTASGTYTPHANMLYCHVRVVGAGGGGGGVAGTAPTNCVSNGAGSGAYSEGLHTAADIGASKAVTIGAAGTAGAAGLNAGGAGGTSSLGALVTAGGGGGGPGGSAGTIGTAPGTSGVAGTGNILAVNGTTGGSGAFGPAGTFVGFAAFGGPSRLSGSARCAYRSAGEAGKVYGGGGAGAMTDQTADLAGGAGAAGIVIVTEFCTT